MHDWWFYQVVSAFGTVVYDSSVTILYRQHAENVVGVTTGIFRWIVRLERYIKSGFSINISSQVEELYRIYGDRMPLANKMLTFKFLRVLTDFNFVSRLAYIMQRNVFTTKKVDTYILKILI